MGEQIGIAIKLEAIVDSFPDYVIERLGRMDGLEAKKMFGGIGLYLGGQFFGIIYQDRLYFKVSDGSRGKYEQAGMEPFQMANKPPMKSYYEVPPEVFEDSERMLEWAKESASLSK